MTDCTHQGRIESARGIGFFSSLLFVAIVGAVAATAALSPTRSRGTTDNLA
jgi:hypothetical protein